MSLSVYAHWALLTFYSTHHGLPPIHRDRLDIVPARDRVCQPSGESAALDIYRSLADVWQVDIPLLYQPLTDAALENGYTYYGIWWEAPGAVKVRCCERWFYVRRQATL